MERDHKIKKNYYEHYASKKQIEKLKLIVLLFYFVNFSFIIPDIFSQSSTYTLWESIRLDWIQLYTYISFNSFLFTAVHVERNENFNNWQSHVLTPHSARYKVRNILIVYENAFAWLGRWKSLKIILSISR